MLRIFTKTRYIGEMVEKLSDTFRATTSGVIE